MKRILIIGSGPIVIGQSAEFDYAGVQAILSLKEAGFYTVVLNSNPATIMTDNIIADKVYIEPIAIDTIEKIIKEEKIDAILPTFGGQTGLNMAYEIYNNGLLDKYNIKFLGTQIEAIKVAEDRDLFRQFLISINESPIESKAFSDFDEALNFAKKISFPVMIRAAYTLAGSGSGIANNQEEFEIIAKDGLRLSKINQILVEKSLYGWKEIEYEVIRDNNGTAICICNMENIDPVGVHTGESIVVTPSQTLDDRIYNILRTLSLKIVNGLNIIGACNVQIALSQDNKSYYIIEVNPRLSRSSALASKATGYPIAKIAAQIAIGKNLHEMKNVINGNSSAACEPVIDYVVTKFPKWNFEKLKVLDQTIGTQMKSTGEVMSIDRTFEGSLFKSLLTIYGNENNIINKFHDVETQILLNNIKIPNAHRMLQVITLLTRDYSISKINQITNIHLWFLGKIKNMISKYLTGNDKIHGEIAYKKIDSCSAEFECKSNYLYSVYDEFCELENDNSKKILIIGSGPISIGQGIEFDYSAVHMINAIKKSGYKSIMYNNNPETLSTDFDIADYLFFEPMNIYYLCKLIEKIKPFGVIFQCGGQMSLKLAFDSLKIECDNVNINILGTSLQSMIESEDRSLFHKAMSDINVLYPDTLIVNNLAELKSSITNIKYPVIMRPSFVIGGRGIEIISNEGEIYGYISEIQEDSYPIVIDEYINGTEYEIDGISDGENVFIPAILEQIEESGVHSGDSMSIYPANLNEKQRQDILQITKKICQKLKIIGFVNIQFIIKDDKIYTIEVNPRASRTVPIVMKITSIDLTSLALDVMLGNKLSETKLLSNRDDFYAVKIPIFSNNKIPQASPDLVAEMKSTGEVLGTGKTQQEALQKAFLSAGYKANNVKNIVIFIDYAIQFDSDFITEELKNWNHFNVNIIEKSDNISIQDAIAKHKPDVILNISKYFVFRNDMISDIQYFSNMNGFRCYLGFLVNINKY